MGVSRERLNCGFCRRPFIAFKCQIANGRKFCSRACQYAARTAAKISGPTYRWVDIQCRRCGSFFSRPPSQASRAAYCSAKCRSAAVGDQLRKVPLTFAELEQNAIWEPNSGCLLWLGALNEKGYGRVSTGGRYRPVHQVSYELVKERISKGLEPDHLCRVRCCINPEHLEAVTHKENLERAGVLARTKDMNAAKRARTHCARGHAYTPRNTRINPNNPNSRTCKECARINYERNRQKRRCEGVPVDV